MYRPLLRPLIAATALFAIAGSTYVYAQQRFDNGGDSGPRAEMRHRLTPEDMAAFTDARIAALRAGLELTPDQAKNWPAFEQALRDLAQLRIDRVKAREAAAQQPPPQAPGSPFDRLASRADAMSKASATLKHVADTGAPLYQSLNDAQKGRFVMLARILRPHHGRRFGENERGFSARRFGENGPGWGPPGPRDDRGGDGYRGRMNRMMQGDDDRDSRL